MTNFPISDYTFANYVWQKICYIDKDNFLNINQIKIVLGLLANIKKVGWKNTLDVNFDKINSKLLNEVEFTEEKLRIWLRNDLDILFKESIQEFRNIKVYDFSRTDDRFQNKGNLFIFPSSYKYKSWGFDILRIIIGDAKVNIDKLEQELDYKFDPEVRDYFVDMQKWLKSNKTAFSLVKSPLFIPSEVAKYLKSGRISDKALKTLVRKKQYEAILLEDVIPKMINDKYDLNMIKTMFYIKEYDKAGRLDQLYQDLLDWFDEYELVGPPLYIKYIGAAISMKGFSVVKDLKRINTRIEVCKDIIGKLLDLWGNNAILVFLNKEYNIELLKSESSSELVYDYVADFVKYAGPFERGYFGASSRWHNPKRLPLPRLLCGNVDKDNIEGLSVARQQAVKDLEIAIKKYQI